jgi:hypothetical protein
VDSPIDNEQLDLNPPLRGMSCDTNLRYFNTAAQ